MKAYRQQTTAPQRPTPAFDNIKYTYVPKYRFWVPSLPQTSRKHTSSRVYFATEGFASLEGVRPATGPEFPTSENHCASQGFGLSRERNIMDAMDDTECKRKMGIIRGWTASYQIFCDNGGTTHCTDRRKLIPP